MTTIPANRADSPNLANDRGAVAWIQLAAVLCFAALATPFFLGRVYVADDLGEFHLPIRNFYAQQLGRGEPFDWMPSLFGGFYVAAEGQLGGYHPLHGALYRYLPLGAAFDLELLASYPLLFLGMVWFLERLLATRAAAYFGALAFTFGSFNLLHFVHPNAVAVVAHIPWLLWAIDHALSAADRRHRACAELGIGLLTASQLLLGYPQYVWFSLLIEGAFVAWRAIATQAAPSAVAWVVVAKLLGLSVAAIQLLPTIDALSDSVRQSPASEFSNSGSLHPLNLLQCLAPYLFRTRVVGQNTHELGTYAGAVPCLLCLWLAFHPGRWGRWRPIVLACAVFGVFALLMATGEFGGLYRLQAWVPLVDRFRFPCRATVLVQFCVAVGAAVAFALLLESARAATDRGHRTDRSDRRLTSVVLMSAGVALVGPLVWPEHVASAWLIWCGPLLLGVAAGLIVSVERGAIWAAAALILFTAFDLSTYGLSYSVYGRTADLHQYVAAAPLPPDRVNNRVVAPKVPDSPRVGDRMLLAGIARVDGYAGLEPLKRLDYNSTGAMQLAGVNWILNSTALRDEVKPRWTPVASTAPRVRLLSRVARDEPLDRVGSLPSDVAALDEPIELPASTPGRAELVSDKPGEITIVTSAPARQLLVTTESFHRGWQAMVDDRTQPVVRVNGDFLGCVVESGEHRICLRFQPASRRVGALVSLGGLGLMLCVFGLHVWGRKPAKKERA